MTVLVAAGIEVVSTTVPEVVTMTEPPAPPDAEGAAEMEDRTPLADALFHVVVVKLQRCRSSRTSNSC